MAGYIVLIPLVLLAVLFCIAIPVFLGIFVYQDAKSRGMEPLLWALIAVLAPSFVGLIIYLVVRRDHIVLHCPSCGGEVREGFTSCPRCGQKLSAHCQNCGTPLRPEWKLCPQCGTEIGEQEPFTPPVMNNGASSKKLVGVVVAILLIPVVLLVIAIAGMAVYTTVPSAQEISYHGDLTEDEFYEDLAVREFEALTNYDENCGIFSVKDANLDKAATDWIAATQKNDKPGFYAKTFYENDGGEISGNQGSGTYNITYGCVVAVINPENGEQYTFTDKDDVYDDGEWVVADDMTIELTELTAVPKEEQKEATVYAKQYGNVFVIRFPVSYEVYFDFDDGHSADHANEMTTDSFNVDLVVKGSKITCVVPIDPDSEQYFNYLPTAETAGSD